MKDLTKGAEKVLTEANSLAKKKKVSLSTALAAMLVSTLDSNTQVNSDVKGIQIKMLNAFEPIMEVLQAHGERIAGEIAESFANPGGDPHPGETNAGNTNNASTVNVDEQITEAQQLLAGKNLRAVASGISAELSPMGTDNVQQELEIMAAGAGFNTRVFNAAKVWIDANPLQAAAQA